MHRMGFAC